MLGCSVAAIKSVALVESGGRGGFDEKGRVLLRFEGHKFRLFTHGKYDKSHPQISHGYHSSHRNCGKLHGYSGFNQAFALDPIAAMKSCSIGMFQPMVFNYQEMGFHSVGEMFDFLKKGEREQLIAFVRLIKNWGLADELRRATLQDFMVFAARYNGASYRDNDYHNKMFNGYKAYKNQPVPKFDLTDAEIDDAINLPNKGVTASNLPIAPQTSFQNPQIGTETSVPPLPSKGQVVITENHSDSGAATALPSGTSSGIAPTADSEQNADKLNTPSSLPASDSTPGTVQVIESKTEETPQGEVKTTVSETKDTFNPSNLPAFIPRFGKQWLLGLVPAGGFLSTILAKLAEMPDWLVFMLGVFSGITATLFVQLIIKHHVQVLDFIKMCYQTTADPTQHNLIPTNAAGFVGQRKTELFSALSKGGAGGSW